MSSQRHLPYLGFSSSRSVDTLTLGVDRTKVIPTIPLLDKRASLNWQGDVCFGDNPSSVEVLR